MANHPGSHGGHGKVSAAEVHRYLGGIDFPAGKNELVEHAQRHDAPQEVLQLMKEFPERQYGSAAEVAEALGEAKH